MVSGLFIANVRIRPKSCGRRVTLAPPRCVQKPYFRRRNSNAACPPSSNNSTSSLTAGTSIEPHRLDQIATVRLPSSAIGVNPTICSASPSTGMFALWLENINCRLRFPARIAGTIAMSHQTLTAAEAGRQSLFDLLTGPQASSKIDSLFGMAEKARPGAPTPVNRCRSAARRRRAAPLPADLVSVYPMTGSSSQLFTSRIPGSAVNPPGLRDCSV